MPLWLVKVSRKVEVTELGDFSIEAVNAKDARVKAKEAIASRSADIGWDENPVARRSKVARIEEVEILADGNEDIKPQL